MQTLLYYFDNSQYKRNENIEAESETEIFEKFFKLNNSLRYCNSCFYTFQSNNFTTKYRDWLQSLSKSEHFTLYYGKNGIVD
jgi:hypothetical protein